ncbi:TetR/AcrR family transcriptional regulator [Dyella caseinilytica]|uniref:TetR/AcrR family transcriptional regulator n=1 Tax=Dyella caseinilytica TaxID=1849581 RepID=A0ABX7GYD7_9GAMM|nr:TetR/AcrR family transcriptional regulator [Dyella caseinilytica]QRN54849.1 TetR/AcrR family transcriptional regulator [Dyella caseinilytica]GFZ97367.1 TetR family transcriptional regulator [Dyella caseinilytica]
MAPTPPAGRRDRKRSQTQDHLAKTAERLFDAYGFDAVTMEQIATEADVAKGTLYNHFSTKEAVLAHWIHTELANDLKHLASDIGPHTTFVDGITLILTASADWCERHRAYLPPYLRFRFLEMGASDSAPESAGSQDMISAFSGLILNSQAVGQMRTDISAEHLAMMFHHLYLSALLRWLDIPKLKLREAFAQVVRLFMEGATSSTVKVKKPGKKT